MGKMADFSCKMADVQLETRFSNVNQQPMYNMFT